MEAASSSSLFQQPVFNTAPIAELIIDYSTQAELPGLRPLNDTFELAVVQQPTRRLYALHPNFPIWKKVIAKVINAGTDPSRLQQSIETNDKSKAPKYRGEAQFAKFNQIMSAKQRKANSTDNPKQCTTFAIYCLATAVLGVAVLLGTYKVL